MAMRVCVLGSGSGGNCTLVEGERTRVLIDAGRLSVKYIRESLEKLGVRLDEITGIVATHAHGDHVDKTTFSLVRKYCIPLHVHSGTMPCVTAATGAFSELERGGSICLFETEPFTVGEFLIAPYRVPHANDWGRNSAGAPVGFVIEQRPGGAKLGYATDLGTVPETLVEAFAGSDALVLESNHDVEWEYMSGRPPWLVNWVVSDRGHLSNDQAGNALSAILARSAHRPKGILLAHLSRDCNSEQLALGVVRSHLRLAGFDGFFTAACRQREISPVIEF
ncbi:MAG: MBL fold metallo-hydrolase [bacterium]